MKIRLLSILIIFLAQVNCFSQEVVLQDNFSDRSRLIDLSELLLWYNDQDTISAFELIAIKDANDLEYQAITLKQEAIGEGGYNSGSAYASTCIDYQLPLYNRHFDTLIIEFDYLSATLSGSGESGRLGVAAMYQYPPEGPRFNDVYHQEKPHPFGRPAYNLRILNKSNDGNGAYLFYGGGKDVLGEFEKTGDDVWLPGFISGPGGFSPGQQENYPLAPVLETTHALVSDKIWQHYTWMITPEHLLVYTRESNETADKNELKMDMLLPDVNDGLIQQINNFYQTSIDHLPANYHYFERIEALRFYFRALDNGYLANVKVSKTSHFSPAVLALASDTLQWLWGDQTNLQIPVSIANVENLETSFRVSVESDQRIIAADEYDFDLIGLDDQFDLPFSENYKPAIDVDTLRIKISAINGWLEINENQMVVLVKDGTVTAIRQQNTQPVFYPNPFFAQLFTSSDEPVSFQIFNSQQQLVNEGVLVKSISLEQLSPGIYFIKYSQGKNIKVLRLIKK